MNIKPSRGPAARRPPPAGLPIEVGADAVLPARATSAFDSTAVLGTIQRALASAGLDSTTGPLHDMTETIRRALTPAARDKAPHRTRSDLTHRFSNDAGSRSYKVHVPALTSEAPSAMIVMLHGCTQSADDFAAGTQMNRLADKHGFMVVYPEQDTRANPSRCWNWFRPEDQSRGAGEPSLIAGIVREAAQRHGVDPDRIFVAGLSAGAAMAVVLGENYPDLFSGVGVHSGLPYGSASDIPSALAAMKGGRSGLAGATGSSGGSGTPRNDAVRARQPVPVIVFHGDRDHTVHSSNGEQIVRQAQQAHGLAAGSDCPGDNTQSGITPGGRRFTRTVHADSQGQIRIESWTLHGGGHAWSGGHASGSFTDGAGPDASAEMVRFFMSLKRKGTT